MRGARAGIGLLEPLGFGKGRAKVAGVEQRADIGDHDPRIIRIALGFRPQHVQWGRGQNRALPPRIMDRRTVQDSGGLVPLADRFQSPAG